MFRFQKFVVFSVFVTAVLSACNSYTPKGAMLGPGNAAERSGEPGYSVPTYAYVQSQVFQPYCISCHSSGGGNPAGVNLETYASVLQNLSKIEAAAVTSQIMPPSHPLPAYAQSILKMWIDGGAPLNGEVGGANGDNPSPTPEPTPGTPATIQPTYTSLALNIFTPKCVVCHSSGGSQSNRPLTSYQAIVNGGWVKAGNPLGSTLYQITNSRKMPPGNPLTAAELQALSTWISNGAQNN